MWLRSEVDQTKEYRVALCQKPNGARNFSLLEFGTSLPANAVLVTEVVPMDLLLRGNLIGISKAVKLESGTPFFVDAHGLWLTQEELHALEDDASEVPWLNGLYPGFAPK